MDLTNIEKEIKKLREEIEKHNYLYYVLQKPEITDYEFDQLLLKLKNLEEKYPQFKDPNSPTQRVGGKASSSFLPVRHNPPMLSLENCYSEQDLIEWYKRIEKNIKDKNIKLVCDLKYDGLSCSLEYENGKFIRASTRGDGEIGEDVTENVKTIKSIPLKINVPEGSYIEIRGEVYLNKKDFEIINHKNIENGEEPFSNPRNAASGSLRQKDTSITAKRNLRFVAHSFGNIRGLEKDIKTQWEYLMMCESLYIPTSKIKKLCKNINEVIEFYKEIEKKREEIEFEIDGIVIKVDDFEIQKLLGTTTKSPRWACAFKFKAHQAKTILKNVIFSVGRTGIVTPVAELEPVKCGGVIISNSTLHNFDEIKRLDIKIGDKVIVERAGDVIPKIVRVVKEERTGMEKDITIPKNCPSCSSPLYKDEDEVYIRCINPNCPEQLRRNIIHFASRDAMNIEGLGENTVDALLEKKLIKNIADIYRLKKEDLLKLDLFKEKKSQNLLSQIENSKSRSLEKLIYALGIKHVGEKVSKILAERFKTMNNLINATLEDLTLINEIGPTIASSVYNFFKNPQIRKLVEELKELGLNMSYISIIKNEKLKGLSFVFTGELQSMSRSQAQNIVIKEGGEVSSSVSKKTSYVVVGKNPGSKLDKAKKLGVKIIDEKEFLDLLK